MAKNTFAHKRILVTGASGFIGSRLIQSLLKKNVEIYALVTPASDLRRLKPFRRWISICRINLINPGAVIKLIRRIKPKIIFHLATYGNHPHHDHENFRKVSRVNVGGTKHLLNALRRTAWERLINLGSSAEYGPKNAPMKETDATHPTTIYGRTKVAQTRLTQAFGRLEQKPVMTLRPFYVYGPGENLGRLIPTAIRHCLKGTLFNLTSLKEKKDFVFIDDMVNALLCAATLRTKQPEIFNIGSGVETTLEELIQTVESGASRKLRFKEGAYTARAWKSNCWAADISKAKKKLGWRPRHNLKSGIRKTVKWVLAQRKKWPAKP